MNHFSDGSVVCNLENTEKFAAIHELIRKSKTFKMIDNIESFEKAVIKREKEMPTGLGHGVAFAHGKTDAVDKLYIGLGISKKGIDFNAANKKPVHFLFLIANPVKLHYEYLKIIGAICKIIRDEDFRKQIISMKKNDDVESIFREKLKELKIC